MSIKERLMQDLKEAMKEKDTVKKNAVTMIRAGILQYEKDNLTELDDDGIIEIISKQLKQRKDSLEEFVKAQRDDLITQAKTEIEILESYLPEQLTYEEVKEIVAEAINRLGVTELKQMKLIMADVLPKVKGRADGKAVNEAVKELIG